MAMKVNNEYCCEIKQYCEHDPAKCPIAKRNKEIDEFEKARGNFINEVTKCFFQDCRKIKNSLYEFYKKVHKN